MMGYPTGSTQTANKPVKTVKMGKKDGAHRVNTGKTLEGRVLTASPFTLYSLLAKGRLPASSKQKCNLLLHLGNSVVLFR